MLAPKATSSFAPSARAFLTTAWVVSQPCEVTTIIVITPAIAAVQRVSLILLDFASRPSAICSDRFLSASLVLIFSGIHCGNHINLQNPRRADVTAPQGLADCRLYKGASTGVAWRKQSMIGEKDENPKEDKPRQQAQGQAEGQTPTAARGSVVPPAHPPKNVGVRSLGATLN
jgi:hypothetical protein